MRPSACSRSTPSDPASSPRSSSDFVPESSTVSAKLDASQASTCVGSRRARCAGDSAESASQVTSSASMLRCSTHTTGSRRPRTDGVCRRRLRGSVQSRRARFLPAPAASSYAPRSSMSRSTAGCRGGARRGLDGTVRLEVSVRRRTRSQSRSPALQPSACSPPVTAGSY